MLSRDSSDDGSRQESRVTLPPIRDIFRVELARSPNPPSYPQLPPSASSPPFSFSRLRNILSEEHGPPQMSASSPSRPSSFLHASSSPLVDNRLLPSLSQDVYWNSSPGSPPHSFILSAHFRSRSSSIPSSHMRSLSSSSDSAMNVVRRNGLGRRLSVPSSRSSSPYSEGDHSPSLGYYHVSSNALQFSPVAEMSSAIPQPTRPLPFRHSLSGPNGYVYGGLHPLDAHHNQGTMSDYELPGIETDTRIPEASSNETLRVEKSMSAGKYECSYCGKRFNRPSSLRIHTNTHTGEKPFQCPYPGCGRHFSVQSNMRRHARVHTAVPRKQSEGSGSEANESPAHTPPSYSPPTPSMIADSPLSIPEAMRSSYSTPSLANSSLHAPRRTRSGQPAASASFLTSGSHSRSMSTEELMRRRGSASSSSSCSRSRSSSPDPEDESRHEKRSRKWVAQ